MKEVNGKWRDLRIFRSKENRDDVVLFFGKAEYEGLSGGYRYESHGGKMLLTDPDGDVIETKTIRKKQKHTKSLKSTSEMRHKKNGFQQGDRVEARWQKGPHYYMARITRVHDDGKSFDLMYDDGFVEKALSRKFLRRPERAKKAIASEQAVGPNSLGRSSEPKTQAKVLPTSKHRGLTWDPERGKWKVSVLVDNRVDVIGFYQTERYAAHLYAKAMQRISKPDTRKDAEVSRHDNQKTSGNLKQKQTSPKKSTAKFNDKQKTSGSSKQKQTSTKKSTVNFNKMEYRTEKTFADNVQVVPRPLCMCARTHTYAQRIDTPFTGERRRWPMGRRGNLPKQAQPR